MSWLFKKKNRQYYIAQAIFTVHGRNIFIAREFGEIPKTQPIFIKIIYHYLWVPIMKPKLRELEFCLL